MEQNTFEVRYNVIGDERKRLVRAMGDILEAEPKYLGAPSFSYEIDYFTVDKNGTVVFDNRSDSAEKDGSQIRWTQQLKLKQRQAGSAASPI